MTSRLLERLTPTVAAYQTASFHLSDDLDRLDRVQRAGAPEAAILYCARILEVLAADALRAAKLEPSTNVFSNLDTLQQYNLIPTTTRYWAHALRRTGNLVRHVHTRIHVADMQLGILLLERWLEWFFQIYPYGPRLANLTQDRQPFGLSDGGNLQATLEKIENLDRNLDILQHLNAMMQAPVLPAVLAEMLLDRGRNPDAWMVLEAALQTFPLDPRLRQLTGLCWSRQGELQKALAYLEPLYEQYKEDEETIGITAGVYKRVWLQDPANHRDWLERSHAAYRQGWKRSRKPYLGINAASTALWLGNAAESRQLADEVRQLLTDRFAALAARTSDVALIHNYWDHVTLAEAELLLGDLAAARRTYTEAFARHAEQRANIAVSQAQMAQVLAALGLLSDPVAFLDSHECSHLTP